MQRIQTFIHWTSILTQVSHVFCCGLPILFSVLSLVSGLGIMAAMPSSLVAFHEVMHDYEMPLLIMAGAILTMGWGLHYISWRIDCRSTGCVHEPCAPKKARSSKILILATILFVVNLGGFFWLHG